jgi:SAM-dependent methyltransferase
MADYDDRFFRYVDRTATVAAEAVVPLIRGCLQPASVLDVGCGRGAWLAAWQRHGVTDVTGIDGGYVDRARLLVAPERFRVQDLRLPFDLGRRFDLVQCLEVAEHLPRESAPALLDSLVRHGTIVLFSAAPPGQGGHDHVNERGYDEWRGAFAARGYSALDYVRPRILGDRRIAPWYRYNVLLYASDEVLDGLAASLRASRLPAGPVPDLAPVLYRLRRHLVRHLPIRVATLLARLKERAWRPGAIGAGEPP